MSTLLYVLWQPEAPGAEPVRLFAVVVASVAIGAVVLPELSDDLWTIRPEQVRGLIPEERVQALQEALIQAQVPEPMWSDRILASALRPLIDVGATPHLIVEDFVYNVHIHPDQLINFESGQHRLHLLETAISGRRVLPPPGPHGLYWVSVARDRVLLEGEFKEDACLFREVMELDEDWDDEQWRGAVEQLCNARIVLGGAAVEAMTIAPPEVPVPVKRPGLVRWYFTGAGLERSARTHERVTVTIALDHAMEGTRNRLFFALSQYYATGSTQVSIRLYDKDDRFELGYDAFLAAALGTSVDQAFVTKRDLCKELTVITADETLVWPGSGVSVTWTPSQRFGSN